jgi:aminoglycoside N3'-acetyltransferase
MYLGSMPEMLKVLQDIVGPQRTLVMPAFFFGEPEFHYDLLKYYRANPKFNARRTPSQMGLLTEIFRRTRDVRFSVHPTHRICALGPQAEALVSGHHLCQTGCGEGSPFDKMTELKTMILGIGVKYFYCMTQTHVSEDLLLERDQYPTKFKRHRLPLTLVGDKNEEIEHTLTVFEKQNHMRRIHPLVRNLLNDEELFEWNFHGAPMFYAHAKRVTEALINAALEGTSVFTPVTRKL